MIAADPELLGRLHDIGPRLRELAPRADAERRLTDEAFEALRSTGVLALNTPRRFGGLELGARAMVEAASTIGYYCPNAAWISVISSVSAALPARFPQALYEKMFERGAPVPMASVVVSPGSDAMREEGGYRINGTWPYASNIWHAEWALGVVTRKETDGTKSGPGFCFLHKDQYTVEDVWHTIGMRGTGSNNFTAVDQFVPDSHVITAGTFLGTAIETDKNAYFTQRLSPISLFGTTIASPPLGATRAALDLVVDAAATRPITYSNYRPQASSGAFAQGIGRVRSKIDTAELCLLHAADTIDAAAANAESMPIEARARVRSDIGHAVHNLGEAMNELAWLHGTATFAEANPLGRLWRDVNTGIRHAITASPLNYEIGGTVMLGNDPPVPLL